MNWRAHSSFRCPSGAQTSLNGDRFQSGTSAPFSARERPAESGYEVVLAGIVRLLGRCRPAAVFWAITFAVVTAIERFSRRCISHILEEIREGFPALANRDAPAAIFWIIRRIKVGTTAKHPRPDAMDLGVRPPMRLIWRGLMAKTSARLGNSSAHARPEHYGDSPAIALTAKELLLPTSSGIILGEHRKFSESLSGNIERLHIAAARSAISSAQLLRSRLYKIAAIAPASKEMPPVFIPFTQHGENGELSEPRIDDVYSLAHLPILAVSGGPSAG